MDVESSQLSRDLNKRLCKGTHTEHQTAKRTRESSNKITNKLFEASLG